MSTLKHLSIGLESALKNAATLYHASAYKNDVLMPGFNYTGKLVEWDFGENNHFLYATTDKEVAIEQGFASAVEHKFELDEFHTRGDTITIVTSSKLVTEKTIEALDVYLYVIEADLDVHWIKNTNATNNLDSEYKTKDKVKDFTVKKIDLPQWLTKKKLIIKGP